MKKKGFTQTELLILIGALVVLGLLVFVGVRSWQDQRNMTLEEKAHMKAMCRKMESIPVGSFITIEKNNDREGNRFISGTYIVSSFDPPFSVWIKGPGPGSNDLYRKLCLYTPEIVRGPNARFHITGICGYGSEHWERLAEWYFLQ